MKITERMDNLENRFSTLEETVNNQARIAYALIRWVIFPLVAILGSAYGISNILGQASF